MSDPELLALPLKSLELPSKTVAKLKPLGVRTVGELYELKPEKLVQAGLVLRELEEISEASGSFGVTWASPEELKVATGASQEKSVPKVVSKAAPVAPPKPAKNLVLPADVVEAFNLKPDQSIGISTADIQFFAPYVDDTGRNFQTPPPSARHLRFIRRLGFVRSASIGGPEHWYLVALVDVSQFPIEKASEVDLFLGHMGTVVSSVVRRMGIKPLAQARIACAIQLGISNKDAPRAAKWIEEHKRWIADSPVFARAVPACFEAVAKVGEDVFRQHESPDV